ncbi:MAG TPA: hypothetical protein VF740_13300 [Candidatus Acidoferrum sp.]
MLTPPVGMREAKNQKQQGQQFIAAAKSRPVVITIINSGYPHVQIIIGQYGYEDAQAAKRKMSQFPAGTSFQQLFGYRILLLEIFQRALAAHFQVQ